MQVSLPRRNNITLIGAGFAGSQARIGAEDAPTAMIEAGLLEHLTDNLECNISYWGESLERCARDLNETQQGMRTAQTVSLVAQWLSKRIYKRTLAGDFILTLGGDHSVAIGAVAGTVRAIRKLRSQEVAVVWVSAHAGIRTPETTSSGDLHDMQLPFLLGRSEVPCGDMFAWMRGSNRLGMKNLLYIGLRDVDEGERKILEQEGIETYFMADVERCGIDWVMDRVLDWIGSDTAIHLSFNIDGLDPLWAPSTSTAASSGLTLREGKIIASRLAASGNMVAMDLVGIDPSIHVDWAKDTIAAGHAIVSSALGTSCPERDSS